MHSSHLKIIALLLMSITSTWVNAQRRQTGIYSNKYEKLVDLTGHNRLHGFHFAPGLTWMLAPFREKEMEILQNGDTSFNYTMKGKGRLGFYAEAGMYHLFPYGRIFHYMDWSVAWKNLKGSQDFTMNSMIESSSTIIAETEGTNNFRYNFLLANVNLNNVKQIGNYSFLQNSIGLNFDYALGKRESMESYYISGSTFDKMIFSLHYKFGFGYKINQKWFIIPILETPIFNIIPFESGKSVLGYGIFDMRYRPIILSVRIAWLRKPKSGDCPPVYGPEGDKSRQERYQMGR